MGTSTDAILVWGFDLGNEEDMSSELQERILFLNDEGYKELAAKEKELGVELVRHCHHECTSYIVGRTSALVVAHRGDPKEIKSLPHIWPSDEERLNRFAKWLGVKPEKGRWLLASYWG